MFKNSITELFEQIYLTRNARVTEVASVTRSDKTDGLTLLLFFSDLSNGRSDHLPLLVLAGCTEL